VSLDVIVSQSHNFAQHYGIVRIDNDKYETQVLNNVGYVVSQEHELMNFLANFVAKSYSSALEQANKSTYFLLL